MDKIIFITGATSGIGEATAELFAKNNYNIIACGRRSERLEILKNKLESAYNIKCHTLCFDVRNNEDVVKAVNSLPSEWKSIDILLNNAGLASGLSSIQDGELSDWDKMIDTNVKGLLYTTKAVFPLLKRAGKGHIVNIASIAGKEVYPNGNVYCATKSAVDALSQAMRIDMLQHGIKVTNVAPGAVETEFAKVRFHGDEEKAKKVYLGFTPLYGADIAEAIYWICNGPINLNVNDIVLTPLAQASPRDFKRE